MRLNFLQPAPKSSMKLKLVAEYKTKPMDSASGPVSGPAGFLNSNSAYRYQVKRSHRNHRGTQEKKAAKLRPVLKDAGRTSCRTYRIFWIPDLTQDCGKFCLFVPYDIWGIFNSEADALFKPVFHHEIDNQP